MLLMLLMTLPNKSHLYGCEGVASMRVFKDLIL